MALLTEKFASRILANLAKQHGGIKQRINGGMRDGTVSWYADRAVDLATITDDMLSEPFQYEIPEPDIKRQGNTIIYTEPDGTQREISSKEANEIMWDYKTKSDEHDRNLTVDQRYNMILFNDGWAVALKPYHYHKEHGTQEPNKKQRKSFNRFKTGIGDTGDHDRTPSPWVTDGGKVQGQYYDPYGVSSDAVVARSTRNAMGMTKSDAEYYAKEAETYHQKAEEATSTEQRMMYQRMERQARENERRVRNELGTLRKKAQNHIMQHKPHSVKPIALNEADVKYIVAEATKRIINEIVLGNTEREYPKYTKGGSWFSNGLTWKENERLDNYIDRLYRGEELTKDEEIDYTWLQAKEYPEYKRRDELFKYNRLTDKFAGQDGYFDDGDPYPSVGYAEGWTYNN